MLIAQPFVLIAFLIVVDPGARPSVCINELLASNQHGIRDEDGDSSDWIELYNRSGESVDLAGFWLSDDPGEPQKWSIPTAIIPGHGHLLVWASDKDRSAEELHTNFALKKSGETLILSNREGKEIDRIDFGPQSEDRSLGRLPDGGEWESLLPPSPGKPNSDAVDVPNVIFSNDGGFFADPLSLELTHANPGAKIYYTIDCSTPTPQSLLYTAPIGIDRTTIIRAIATLTEGDRSEISTGSFIFEPVGSLPSLSVVVAPDDLHDASRGLLTNRLERGDRWERLASIEWFVAGEREFGHNCGLRVHGGISRSFEKNSFRIYFSGGYGPDRLEYPLFSDLPVQSFKRLVLSGGSNDTIADNREIHSAVWTLLRDALLNELFREAGVQAIGQRPAKLFLNGEPWGIYWIKERIDKYFVDDHFGFTDFDLLKHDYGVETKEGDLLDWEGMIDYLMEHSLHLDENYHTVEQWIDLDNFIDNHVLEMWALNVDWPQNNHYQLRERAPDSKWVWIPWDSDFVLGSPYVLFHDYNMYDHVSGQHRFEADWSTLHFRSLMAHPVFRSRFVERAEELLETVLHPSHVEEKVGKLAEELREDIAFETERWGSDPEDWEKNVTQLIQFVHLRDASFRDHTEAFRAESGDPAKLGATGILNRLFHSDETPTPETLFDFVLRQMR